MVRADQSHFAGEFEVEEEYFAVRARAHAVADVSAWDRFLVVVCAIDL